MKKASSKCVFRRPNGIYCFRRAVPKDLIGAVGKREWKVSLQTTDVSRAHLEAISLLERTDRQIAQLRGIAGPAEPVDRDVPASNEQVVHVARSLSSRRTTLSIGRLHGRIGGGRVRGEHAAELLEAFESDLAELERLSPLASAHKDFSSLLSDIERRTNRKIEPDSALEIELRKIHWNAQQHILRTNIAQMKGDDEEVFRLNSHRRNKPNLQSLVSLFMKHRTSEWSPKTHDKFKAVSTVLIDILGADRKLSTIDRETARDLGDVLHSLPPNYAKRSALKGLGAREAASLGRELELPTLSRKTVQDYYNHISSLFEFAVHEDLMKRNPMKGLSVYADKPPSKRRPFTRSDLQKLFSAPIFTGCVDDEKCWRKRSDVQVRRGRYWVPIIALHTGMRLNEICALRKGDIKAEDGVSFIDVSDSGGRRLKTANASRIIPVHSQLVRLGFLEWVWEQPGGPSQDLFPELPMDKSGSRSNAFSKWFGRLLKSAGVCEEGKSFHSFRHLFEDILRDAEISMENNERIMGWGNSHIQRSYGTGPSLKQLDRDIKKLDWFAQSPLAHLVLK